MPALMDPGNLARVQSSPEDWLGPFYLSAVLDSLFFGILCCQVWTYHSEFPKDLVWLKRLVGLTYCLSLFKNVKLSYIVWRGDIVGFGNWEKAIAFDWAIPMEPVIGTMVSTSAQTFFVWRCYVLTERNRYLLAAFVTAMLTPLTLSASLSVQMVVNGYDRAAGAKQALPMIGTTIVLDSAITFILSYKLIVSQKGGNRNTDMILRKLLIVTWESALPPLIAQFGKIGVCLGMFSSAPNWSYLMSELTANLYVFSLMYCLNSRLEVRKLSLAMQSADYAGRVPDMPVVLSEIRFRKNQTSFPSADTDSSTGPGTSRRCTCQPEQGFLTV